MLTINQAHRNNCTQWSPLSLHFYLLSAPLSPAGAQCGAEELRGADRGLGWWRGWGCCFLPLLRRHFLSTEEDMLEASTTKEERPFPATAYWNRLYPANPRRSQTRADRSPEPGCQSPGVRARRGSGSVRQGKEFGADQQAESLLSVSLTVSYTHKPLHKTWDKSPKDPDRAEPERSGLT